MVTADADTIALGSPLKAGGSVASWLTEPAVIGIRGAVPRGRPCRLLIVGAVDKFLDSIGHAVGIGGVRVNEDLEVARIANGQRIQRVFAQANDRKARCQQIEALLAIELVLVRMPERSVMLDRQALASVAVNEDMTVQAPPLLKCSEDMRWPEKALPNTFCARFI